MLNTLLLLNSGQTWKQTVSAVLGGLGEGESHAVGRALFVILIFSFVPFSFHMWWRKLAPGFFHQVQA